MGKPKGPPVLFAIGRPFSIRDHFASPRFLRNTPAWFCWYTTAGSVGSRAILWTQVLMSSRPGKFCLPYSRIPASYIRQESPPSFVAKIPAAEIPISIRFTSFGYGRIVWRQSPPPPAFHLSRPFQ